jgi:hypothetical protein
LRRAAEPPAARRTGRGLEAGEAGLQLTFDLEAAPAPTDRLRDRRRIGRDGPARLLLELVQRGLGEDALPVAAALVLALDAKAGERR